MTTEPTVNFVVVVVLRCSKVYTHDYAYTSACNGSEKKDTQAY